MSAESIDPPRYQLMPALRPDENSELRDDIKARGVMVPVEYDEAGNILDGHHRVAICKELGIAVFPFITRTGMSEADKLTHVRRLNLVRRHLDREQRRALIAGQLRDTPQVSDRRIADGLGVDHKTVGAVRGELESIGEFPQCDRQTRDGRTYPRDVERSTFRPHLTRGTGENEWYTPKCYTEAARAVMGDIELDPASSATANESVGANEIFTLGDNGLLKEWHGLVWLNPPYAQPAIGQFIEKLLLELKAGRVKEAILLTHNYTDTAWFHAAAIVSNAICFTRGRIGFLSPEGKTASPTQGQAFFYYGTRMEEFYRVFASFGHVVVKAAGTISAGTMPPPIISSG
jgi:hypothetical protein